MMLEKKSNKKFFIDRSVSPTKVWTQEDGLLGYLERGRISVRSGSPLEVYIEDVFEKEGLSEGDIKEIKRGKAGRVIYNTSEVNLESYFEEKKS